MKNNILFIDIETFPDIAYAWNAGRMQEIDLIEIIQEGGIASFAYKWQGNRKVYCHTREGQKNDKQLMKKLRDVLDIADIVVAQNGKQFDIKTWQARMQKYGISPPSPYRVIDTLIESRKIARLNSHSLKAKAAYYGNVRKRENRGFPMWKECMADDPKAWREMVRYNKRDITSLEDDYNTHRAWMKSHPHVAPQTPSACPRCGEVGSMQSRGFNYSNTSKFAKYQCKDCKGWSTARVGENLKPQYKSA